MSAISLKEIGINYCLIGHSETKINITNTDNLNNSILIRYLKFIYYYIMDQDICLHGVKSGFT